MAEKTFAEHKHSQSPPSDTILQKGHDAIEIVDKYKRAFSSRKTYFPALYLHTYNFLNQYPDPTSLDINKELGRYEQVIHEEEMYAKDPRIPTIGTEVEVRYKHFPFLDITHIHLSDVLEEMGLVIKEEGEHKTEISLPPTHSAHLQYRMLSELAEFGFIPKVSSAFTSLHINLGFPTELANSSIDVVHAISNLLTYAYVPAKRVEKWHYQTDAYFNIDGVPVNGLALPINYDDDTGIKNRTEFRTPKFIGSETHQLLSQVQILGAVMNSSSPQIKYIARSLVEDVWKLLARYHLKSDYLSDSVFKDLAAEAIEQAQQERELEPDEPNLIDDARRLMKHYAGEISSTLKRNAAW